MAKRSAFIIKDHKTYVHAEEAWYRFHGKKEGAILFVIVPDGDPNNVIDTLEEIIDENIWEEVIWVKTRSNFMPRSVKEKKGENRFFDLYVKYREYFYNALDAKYIKRLAKKYQDVELVFSGHKNTQEHLAACLNPTELYLMDSGNFIEKVSDSGFVDYTRHSRYSAYRMNRIMFRLTGLKLYDRKKTKLFTVYADDLDIDHDVVKNNQDYKKSRISEKEQGDDIFYISSPLYTFSSLVTIHGYIEYLKKIFDKLHIKYSDVVYIPNPIREKKEDIDTIIRELGCKKDDRVIPVEIKVAISKLLPKACISPYSTALININEITQKRVNLYCAWHPEFKYFDQLVKLRNNLLDVESNGIHFIEIDDAPSLFPVGKNKYNGKPLFKNFIEWNKELSA